MPLDRFQKEVVEVISAERDHSNPFAGGSVIQHYGFRLSDDHDILADGASRLDQLMQADCASLEAAGFTVRQTQAYSGFRECRVMKPTVGTTTLQWTAGIASEFYAPVPDPNFGWRLHFADLAVNKALAAGARMKMRDFIDLWLLDRHVLPLWRMACAAPGKNTDVNPFSLIKAISYNWSMTVRSNDLEDPILLSMGMNLEGVGTGLRQAIREAQLCLPDVRPEHYGRLQFDQDGNPVTDRNIIPFGTWQAPRPGGALPTFEGTDSEMIAGLISEYGLQGGDKPCRPAAVSNCSL